MASIFTLLGLVPSVLNVNQTVIFVCSCEFVKLFLHIYALV